jgi:hypothetical protein
MPNYRQLVVAALVLSVAAACSNPVDLNDPTVVAAELRGTWARSFSVPGVSTVFVISVQDLTVTGSGTFANEAGPSGTLAITGHVTTQQTGRPLVQIDFAQSDGFTGHFEGTLTDTDSLYGSVWYSSAGITADPVTATFRRQ